MPCDAPLRIYLSTSDRSALIVPAHWPVTEYKAIKMLTECVTKSWTRMPQVMHQHALE
jgi:hypothetical protein